MAEEQLYCEKCHKTMHSKEFYNSNNLEKYPTGKLNMCKKCATMRIDNFDPNTYLWLLQEVDVPYIPEEWNILLAKFGKDPTKLTSMSIFGRYLSKMKLKQWKDFRWKDNDFVAELYKSKLKTTMQNQGYSAAEIETAVREQQETFAPPAPAQPLEFAASDAETPVVDLTDDDRTYLTIKWGKAYRPDEWVRLEQLYDDMMQSYDIQSAGDKNTLILACKTSLKANQLLDIGDIDGAQKATKMYDSLMKSGKWTAAQNKAEKGEFIDSVSELVTLCEKQGFIPRYYVDGPQDKVDKVLLDTQHYVHNLVTEEMGLGALIENAIKLMHEEAQNIAAAGVDGLDEDAENDLFDYDKEIIDITDEDLQDFRDAEEAEAIIDSQLFEEGE